MSKPWALDLFCGAGGCAKGYQRAGFKVVGVDHCAQPRYVGEQFIQADALEYLARMIESSEAERFAFIHASPPCQAYSPLSSLPLNRERDYPLLIDPIRELLIQSRLPYFIENVEAAPLTNLPLLGAFVITLCGSMFELNVRRHRRFESNLRLKQPECRHQLQAPRFPSLNKRRNGKLACVVGVHGHVNYSGEAEVRMLAMDIDWMNQTELTQAIPPAYTEFIGHQILELLS